MSPTLPVRNNCALTITGTDAKATYLEGADAKDTDPKDRAPIKQAAAPRKPERSTDLDWEAYAPR